MTNANVSLDDLRGEIDEIDSAIHDLLMRRAALAEYIGALKDDSARIDGAAAAAYLRPGREAAVLRRLVLRHSGSFPVASLVRLWREIMSSLLRLQGPFSVAVFAVADKASQWPGYWDLARDHYGSTTPMTACQSAGQVLGDIADGRATVGVLPFPEEGEAAPWWPLLASGGRRPLSIIARLPFVAPPEGAGDRNGRYPSAVAVACLAPEQTDDDRSLLAVEIAAELSRARVTAALTGVGLTPLWHIVEGAADGRSGSLYLVEIDGFVAPDDARLAQLVESLGPVISRVFVLGAYPTPITIGEEPAQMGNAVTVGAGAGRGS